MMLDDDPTLADDLRAAAKKPSGLFPTWVYDEMEHEADRIDDMHERWTRLAEGKS